MICILIIYYMLVPTAELLSENQKKNCVLFLLCFIVDMFIFYLFINTWMGHVYFSFTHEYVECSLLQLWWMDLFYHQVKIVHICEVTLRKRLIEFENTESGSLTVSFFYMTVLHDCSSLSHCNVSLFFLNVLY